LADSRCAAAVLVSAYKDTTGTPAAVDVPFHLIVVC